jgi:crossover junction endodeoxyribonuclease RusA
VEVSVRFYFKTKRKRDLDNQNKLILDAFTGIAYEDDNQISALHLT